VAPFFSLVLFDDGFWCKCSGLNLNQKAEQEPDPRSLYDAVAGGTWFFDACARDEWRLSTVYVVMCVCDVWCAENGVVTRGDLEAAIVEGGIQLTDPRMKPVIRR
jgi:hypothetical protein